MMRMRRVVVALLWVGLLGATIIGLPRLGGATLRGPSGWSWPSVRLWLDTRSPDVVVMACVRIVVVATAWYLLVTLTLSTVMRATRIASLVRIVDLVTLPTVRRIAAGAVGLSVAAAPTLAPAWAMAAGPPAWPPSARAASAVPVMRLLDNGDSPAPTTIVSPTTTTAAATTTVPAPTTTVTSPAPPAVPPAVPSAAPAQSGVWVVEPGDHLWRIAARSLAQAWGREPTIAEIGSFWTRLIAVNPQFPNPSLIYQGETVFLPAVPPRPPARQILSSPAPP